MRLSLHSVGAALFLAAKGMVYGLTHLVPGIGGGLILIVMGIYEQFVDVVGNLFVQPRRWREFLAFLVPLGGGMVVSLVVFSRVVTVLAENYPVPLAFFFMGLLIGTVPTVLRLHGDMRPTAGRAVAFLVGLGIVLGLRSVQSLVDGGLASLTGARAVAFYGGASFLAGGASVTPGLDGSYIWMLTGVYTKVVDAIGRLLELQIDWGVLVPAGLGAVLGILAFSKVIDAIIKKAPAPAYYAVLGLIVGALYGLWPENPASSGLIGSVAAFAAGAAAAYGLSRTGPAEAA